MFFGCLQISIFSDRSLANLSVNIVLNATIKNSQVIAFAVRQVNDRWE